MADTPTLDELIAWAEGNRDATPGARALRKFHARYTALAAHLRRLQALDAAVQRVRELHRRTRDGFCAHCMAEDEDTDIAVHAFYPCGTIRALDAEAAP